MSRGRVQIRRAWGSAALAGVSLFAMSSVSALAQQTTGGPTVLDPLVVIGRSEGEPPATGTVGQPPAPLPGGQVASGVRLGALGNRSLLDTPFSAVSYTEKLIRDQQARSVADVTLNDPSVRADAPAYSERDSFFIRGFSVTNLDTLYDGLPYIANPRRHFLEGIERVEILKGPTALVNGGTGRVGGTINLVPKRATDEPLTRLTTTYLSDAQIWSHVDFGRRLGPEGEWGVRFNGSYRAGDTAYDNNDVQVGVASLGLDYRGERVRASLDLNHSTQNIDAPTSLFNAVAPGVAIPRAPDGRINAANPFEYHDSTYNMAAGRIEFDVLPNTTIYAAGGASRYREDFLTTSYTIGDPRLVSPGVGDAQADFGFNPQEIQGFSGEVGLRSEFDTGAIGHQLSISAARSLNENNRGEFNPRALGFPSYPTNIYDPVYLPGGSVDTSGLPRSNELIPFADLVSTSIAISDTISFFDERFQLTLGGRYQDIRSRAFNTNPARGTVGEQTYFYEDARFSPAVAAVFNINNSLSVYANYVEALTEGEIAPVTAVNSGDILPPFVSDQKEIGVKYDLGSFALTAALFEIRQESAFTDPATGIFSADGLQANRGIELSIFGEPIEGLRLLGGITFMDAQLARTAGGTFEGNRARGVPKTAISLYGEYDMPWLAEGLTLTGRALYNGSTYYDAANTQKVSDWTRFDVGLRYALEGPHGKPVEFRANVENVFNENYWASSARGFLAAGAPRTFTLSASFDF